MIEREDYDDEEDEENNNNLFENDNQSNEEGEDNNVSRIISENIEKKPLKEYIFYVVKLGQKGIIKKPRILHVDESGIYYYPMVSNRKDTESFLTHLKESQFYYANWQVSNIQQLIKEFYALPPKDRRPKGSFSEYSIRPQEKISSFHYPIRIVNEEVDRSQQLNTINFWIMETFTEEVQSQSIGSKHDIVKAIKEEEIAKEEKRKGEELKNKQLQEEEEERRRLEEMNRKEQENNDKEGKRLMSVFEKKEEYENKKNLQTYDYEILYQASLREYYELIKANKDKKEFDSHVEKIALELNIYHLYNQFVTKCSQTIQKIVKDFNTLKPTKEDFETKLHPIVYPNSFFFSDENNAVLLYHIWGVNYTMTWNKLSLKLNKAKESHQQEPSSNSQSIPPNSDNNTQFTKGKWKGLKKLFKQKDYFQDFFMKIASSIEKIDGLPSIPMSCIIDYYGFRFYCENDISFSESSILSNYNKTQYSQFDLSQPKQMEFSLVREIGRILNSNNDKLDTSDVIYEINPKDLFKNDYDKKLVIKGNESFHQTFINNFSKPPNEDRAKLKYMNIMKMLSPLPNDKNYSSITSIFPIENDLKVLKYLMNFDILPPNPVSNHCHTRQEIIFSCFNDHIEEKKESEIEKEKEKPEKIQLTIINKTENNFNLNIEDEKETFKSKEVLQKIKQNLYLNNNREDSANGNSNKILEKEFNRKFKSLLMALDSLYLKPYNSETLKMCLHYFGINMHFLGKIAEESKVPHIREICVIEMFARICKRIIFDLLGQRIFEHTMKDLYAKEQRITKSFSQIPVSFNIHYGSEYLKSINIPVEEYQFIRQNDSEIKGLYIPYNETNPLQEENGQNEQELESDNLISSFLSTLFDQSDVTFKITLYGKEHNKSSLWEMILDLIKSNFIITSEEIFMYCNLECMSNCALLSSIQYHTGITIPSSFFNGDLSTLTGKECIYKQFEKIKEITPKVSLYNFNILFCQKGKILPLANNFSLVYPGEEKKHLDYYYQYQHQQQNQHQQLKMQQQHQFDQSIKIYPQAKLFYFSCKFLLGKSRKENPLYYYYFFYLKILKRWDKEKEKFKIKDSINQLEKPKKGFDINSLNITDTNVSFNQIFENNFYLFIYLIFTQYQPKSAKSKGDAEKEIKAKSEMDFIKKIEIDYNYLKKVEKIISIYWNSKHPFISILNMTFAKALYKNTDSRSAEDKIESCFSIAVDIAKDSMGELNIYYGRITRDVGFFYNKNLKYFNSFRMFYASYKVFNKHKSILLKDYHYSLKYLTKSCVYLGRIKECFQYGKLLIDEFSNQMKANDSIKNDEDRREEYTTKREQLLIYWKKMHIETFAYNLMILAIILREYESGIEIGNIYLYQLINEADRSGYQIKGFKKWVSNSEMRIDKLKIKKSDQNSKEYYKTNSKILICEQGIDIGIEYIFEEYLKNVFCNLKGIWNKTFARAFVAIETEYRNSAHENISKNANDFEAILSMFYQVSGIKMSVYFNNCILASLRNKYDLEMYSVTPIVIDNYNKAINDIKTIYRYYIESKHLFVTINSFKNE